MTYTYEGTPGASDAYASGFTWLDKLGLTAIYGGKAVFRQGIWGCSNGLYSIDNAAPLPGMRDTACE